MPSFPKGFGLKETPLGPYLDQTEGDRRIPIRSAEKVERMRTLTVVQHALLEAVRERPFTLFDEALLQRVSFFIGSAKTGGVDLVRVAVAAGQLHRRELLDFRFRGDQSVWLVTDEGLEYLD